MKNNKILVPVWVALLVFIIGGSIHTYNKEKTIWWNSIHNILLGNKTDIIDNELPFESYNKEMDEHCEMMPEMNWCEKYVELQNEGEKWGHWMMMNMWNDNSSDFNNYNHHDDLDSLPEAKKSEIVELNDGDTYEMSASIVKQEVWNRVVKRLAYNGMIPGPLLKVEKGSKINLILTNNLDVETTLHSHGLRLDDSKFDGLPTTMMWEQPPMKPGDSFTYELNFPDTGVFWYHPHIREDYTQEMWLYGNFAVTEENYWMPVDSEEYLILDDFSEDDIFYKDKVNKTLMGRFGNIMMINNDEDYELNIKQYETTRLYLTNVANTRTFNFEIVNKNWENIDLKLVWWDIGRIEKEIIIKSQIIAPAERYIIELGFNIPWEYIIKSRDRILWKIIVEKSKTESLFFDDNLRTNLEDYKNIRDNMDEFLSKEADKKLRLTIQMGNMKMGWIWWMDHWEGSEKIEWIEWEDDMAMMNKMSTDKMIEWKLLDEETGNENMDIEWKFKKWEFVKVEIFNDPNSMHPMQHPVHFHGQRFVVLTRDWIVNENLQWKDTTLVKNWEKIEILIEMTNVWLWMSHCHIAEHLQSGMMMNFRVED